MAEQTPSRDDLDYDIYIYLNGDTRKVETVVSYGPFGQSEYDPAAQRWVAIGTEDTWRIRDLSNNCAQYAIDWKNEKDFDANNKIITLQKYSDGSLDENYLKENATFITEPLS